MVGGQPGAVAVGEVDVADRDRVHGPGEQHCGQADFDQPGGQRVVRVGGDEDRAVGAALLEVADHLVPGLDGVGDHQQRVQPEGAQRADHPAEGPAEEGVGEHAVPGALLVLDLLGHAGEDERDRAGPAGDERAGGAVGDVAGGGDGQADALLDVGVDVADPVDHAGHRRPGDPGDPGHVLQGRGPGGGGSQGITHSGFYSTPKERSLLLLAGAPGGTDGPPGAAGRPLCDSSTCHGLRLRTPVTESGHGAVVTERSSRGRRCHG